MTVTNVSCKQALSKIFFMTATKAITDANPIHRFGQGANNALAALALDADPTEVLRRYAGRQGVQQAKSAADAPEKYLNGGGAVTFAVDATGHGDRLTENYVSVHRGMQLVDSDNDLEDLLLFPEYLDSIIYVATFGFNLL